MKVVGVVAVLVLVVVRTVRNDDYGNHAARRESNKRELHEYDHSKIVATTLDSSNSKPSSSWCWRRCGGVGIGYGSGGLAVVVDAV